MKKHLLVIAALTAALCSSAFSVGDKIKLNPISTPGIHSVKIPSEFSDQPVIGSRAEAPAEEVYYTLAGNPKTALGYNNQTPGMEVAMAFQIEPSFLSSVTDGQITGISFYTGTQSDEQVNKIAKATVFIADALDGTYLYTQQTSCPTTPFTKVNVRLNTPFDIPAGSKIYVGVYFTLTSEDNIPVIVDYIGHANNRGGWVATRSSKLAKWSWDNIASSYGFVTLGATIKSSSLPKNSVSLTAVDGQPVAFANSRFGFDFLLENNGVNNINKITVEFGIEGEPVSTGEFTIDGTWGINQSLVASITDFSAKNATKSSDITVKVIAVNGEPNNSTKAEGSYAVTIVPEGTDLQRNVVIEEFTSISCVYCPVGYTAMEKIHDEYTDGDIIPVCIHVNSPGRDPMTASSYNGVFANYCTDGVPSTTVNRSYTVYPYYEDLIEMAEAIQTLPGVAKVSGEATIDKDTRKLTIKTNTTFAFDYTDGNSNFILAYGITEDDLGPYNQKNGYAGSDQPVPGDWQDEPSTISLIYNDVARQLDKYSGVAGSIPAEIKAGESYPFTHEMTVLQAINNLDKIHVIVYLINRKTGAIENACSLSSNGDGSFTGIETIIADGDSTDAPVEYYNLQGVRVNNPEGGIYIRRQAGKVSKVLVR